MLNLRRWSRAVTVWVVLLCVAGPAAAQWKWRDANGRVTVSDMPPPRGTPDRDILQRPAPPRPQPVLPAAEAASAPASAASGNAAAPARSDREAEARKRAAEQERQAKAKADEEAQRAQRAENCRRARSQLALVESGQRMVRVNEKGEREVLDDSGRAAEARRARDAIAADCR